MEDGRWRGWTNAEIYDRFVRERGIYRWLNERLVERAAIESARRVLDLGCGTGATTQACLRLLPPDGEVIGLDASEEMVAVARAQTLDPRARFVVASASEADSAIEGPFDRCVSNAAFWQFPDRPRVLNALARLLEPGARLVFDVPAERVESRGVPFHPFQVALARAIAERRGEPFVRTSTLFDAEAFRAEAGAAGFEWLSCERLEWEGAQGELVELMRIPAMTAPIARTLGEAGARAAVEEAAAAVEPEERVRVVWLYFTLARSG